MTRINVIPPSDLTDAHLLAEYRELPRVFALAYEAKDRAYSATPDLITVSICQRHDMAEAAIRTAVPKSYTLGPGHVRFFYPRTAWLAERQSALIAECLSRGFNITHRTAPAPVPGLDDGWTPDADAVAVNLGRLRERLAERPGFYTYGGMVVSPSFY